MFSKSIKSLIKKMKDENQKVETYKKRYLIIQLENKAGRQFFAIDSESSLGSGSYASVYKAYKINPSSGKIDKSQTFAAKVFNNPFNYNEKEKQLFSHYYSVAGVVKTDDLAILITEFIEGESINEDTPLSKTFTFAQRVNSIARLMLRINLLHHETPQTGPAVVHSDLRGANLLAKVDENTQSIDMLPVDFGLTDSLEDDDPSKMIDVDPYEMPEITLTSETLEQGKKGIKTDIAHLVRIIIWAFGGNSAMQLKARTLNPNDIFSYIALDQKYKDYARTPYNFSGMFEELTVPSHPVDIKSIIIDFLNRMQDVEYNSRANSDEALYFFITLNNFCEIEKKSPNDPNLYCHAAKLLLLAKGFWQQELDPISTETLAQYHSQLDVLTSQMLIILHQQGQLNESSLRMLFAPNKKIASSYDADNHFFSSGSESLTVNEVLDRNEDFLRKTAEMTPGRVAGMHVYNGSNRQSAKINEANMKSKRSPSYFPIFEKVAEKLSSLMPEIILKPPVTKEEEREVIIDGEQETIKIQSIEKDKEVKKINCTLEKLLLPDSLYHLAAGTTFASLSQKENETEYNGILDHSKILMLYAQIHHFASQYSPTDPLVFYFSDDSEQILEGLSVALKANPYLIPNNVMFVAHKHVYGEDRDDKVISCIQGTGTCDKNYPMSVIKLFEKAGYGVSDIGRPNNLDLLGAAGDTYATKHLTSEHFAEFKKERELEERYPEAADCYFKLKAIQEEYESILCGIKVESSADKEFQSMKRLEDSFYASLSQLNRSHSPFKEQYPHLKSLLDSPNVYCRRELPLIQFFTPIFPTKETYRIYRDALLFQKELEAFEEKHGLILDANKNISEELKSKAGEIYAKFQQQFGQKLDDFPAFRKLRDQLLFVSHLEEAKSHYKIIKSATYPFANNFASKATDYQTLKLKWNDVKEAYAFFASYPSSVEKYGIDVLFENTKRFFSPEFFNFYELYQNINETLSGLGPINLSTMQEMQEEQFLADYEKGKSYLEYFYSGLINRDCSLEEYNEKNLDSDEVVKNTQDVEMLKEHFDALQLQFTLSYNKYNFYKKAISIFNNTPPSTAKNEKDTINSVCAELSDQIKNFDKDTQLSLLRELGNYILNNYSNSKEEYVPNPSSFFKSNLSKSQSIHLKAVRIVHEELLDKMKNEAHEKIASNSEGTKKEGFHELRNLETYISSIKETPFIKQSRGFNFSKTHALKHVTEIEQDAMSVRNTAPNK